MLLRRLLPGYVDARVAIGLMLSEKTNAVSLFCVCFLFEGFSRPKKATTKRPDNGRATQGTRSVGKRLDNGRKTVGKRSEKVGKRTEHGRDTVGKQSGNGRKTVGKRPETDL